MTFVPSQLVVHDQKVFALGTSYDKTTIRYPSIQQLGFEPHVLPSATSARGLVFKSNTEGQAYFSYYQAKSLTQPEETSKLFVINQDFDLDLIISYGHRTRIIDFIPLPNQQFISLNYERGTANTSIIWIDDGTVSKKIDITIGQETTIPKQIMQLENGDLLLIGIADGFEFKDGHSYKEQYAKGFVLLTDNEGVEKQRWIQSGDNGHVFFKEAIINSGEVFVIGQIQQDRSGMDAMILKLNAELEPIDERMFKELNHQDILSVELNENTISLFIKTQDDEGNKIVSTKLLSTQLDILDEQTTDGLLFFDVLDVVNKDNDMYVLVHDRKNRGDIVKSEILRIKK